jgi:hypothetical protein
VITTIRTPIANAAIFHFSIRFMTPTSCSWKISWGGMLPNTFRTFDSDYAVPSSCLPNRSIIFLCPVGLMPKDSRNLQLRNPCIPFQISSRLVSVRIWRYLMTLPPELLVSEASNKITKVMGASGYLHHSIIHQYKFFQKIFW